MTELPGDPDALSREEILAGAEPLGFRVRAWRPLRGGCSVTLELGEERSP